MTRRTNPRTTLSGIKKRVDRIERRLRTKADKADVRSLERKMDAGFSRMNAGFSRSNRKFRAIDDRFDGVDKRFDAVDRRFDSVDKRFGQIDRRFMSLEEKFDSLMGIVRRQHEDVMKILHNHEERLLDLETAQAPRM